MAHTDRVLAGACNPVFDPYFHLQVRGAEQAGGARRCGGAMASVQEVVASLPGAATSTSFLLGVLGGGPSRISQPNAPPKAPDSVLDAVPMLTGC